MGFQVLASVGFLEFRDLFGAASTDDPTAFIATFWSEVNDPVRAFDHFHVVFDDDDRVTFIDEPVQYFEQQFDVLKVQPGRRFVEDVEGPPGCYLRKFLCQLNALGFAT